MHSRLPEEFFRRHVLEVSPELIGKTLVRKFDKSELQSWIITEVEAYSGNGDLACHASKGFTPRTEVMFREGGLVYVYLIYGMHWLLNLVTGHEGDASAVLIRGIEGISGPGRVGKVLKLNKTFYGENLATSQRIWIEDTNKPIQYTTTPRIGIDYAGEPWISKPWRYILKNS
ncbi:MAG: DNA-3-methyladenine glycosylase [Mariniphaga sp.]|nr:DNA-3-methyladenine glycosylase [Mariniphaga sp.]MDD4224990.1 DNA-3-methyladenine glycosylase [Mariniphaga sp.]MDD4424482.1 DNA-3-methyladenine glycosylase [Mariniphaga sp.]